MYDASIGMAHFDASGIAAIGIAKSVVTPRGVEYVQS
jgi:hypothetical protein